MRWTFAALAAAIAAPTPALFAQQRVRIQATNSSCSPCNGLTYTTDLDQAAIPGSTLFINESNALSTCTYQASLSIYPGDTITNLERLDFSGGTSCEVFQVIISTFGVQSISPDTRPPVFDANWGGLANVLTDNVESMLYAGIQGNITGSVVVDRIAYLRCEGTIVQDIVASSGFPLLMAPDRGAIIEAGTVGSQADIKIGKLESLDISYNMEGSHEFDVVTGNIDVGGSQIGGVIQIKESMFGDIAFGGSSYYVQLSEVDARLQGDVSTGVDFGTTAGGNPQNSFAAWDFNGSLFVGRDVCSPIIIDGDWEDGTEVIRIGRSLEPRTTGMATVGNRMLMLKDQIPGDGLQTNILDEQKQIIINAGNHTPSTDDNGDGTVNIGDFWLGDVAIGFVGGGNLPPSANKYAPAFNEVLIGPDVAGSGYSHPAAYLAPYYKALSYELGGGAIGVAPFNFHQFTGPTPGDRDLLDCNPHHLEVLFVGPCEDVETLPSVTIDHYGPVYVLGDDNDELDRHFRVEYRPDDAGGLPSTGWNEVSHLFQVDSIATNTAPNPSNPNRKIVIKGASGNTPGFASAGRFRIRPEVGKVKCDGLTASPTPDVLWKSSIQATDCDDPTGPVHNWYQFRVRLAPCQGMAVLEGEQVNSWDFATWLNEPFEVNSDGQTDVNDFVHMTNSYNASN